MRPTATYATVLALFSLAVAAMAWSALRPENSPGHALATTTSAAFSDLAAWFRSGPADGQPDWEAAARNVYGADASHGAQLMVLHGCGACHTIPGVTGADGSVGPDLGGLADRAYVGGVLPNEPGGLVRWLVNPTTYAPNTAMPDLGVTEAEARDMAAYLFTLRGE